MCKFQVGSYSYDDTKMVFVESERVKGYVETSRSIVLDYDVHIAPLSQQVGIRISSPSLPLVVFRISIISRDCPDLICSTNSSPNIVPFDLTVKLIALGNNDGEKFTRTAS